MVDSLAGYTEDQLADRMGFESVQEFQKYYEKETEDAASGCADHASSSAGESFVDNFTALLQQLLREYGDTVAYSFMFFLFGSKMHLAIQANPTLKRSIEEIARVCADSQLDINKALTGLLCVGMQFTGFDRDNVNMDLLLAAAEAEQQDFDLHAVTKKGTLS